MSLMPRPLLVLVTLVAAPAAAQPMPIERWDAGADAPGYTFETRIDTTDAGCGAPDDRLFAPGDEGAACGPGRWLVVLHHGVAVDSLDAPMAWLGTEPDTSATPPMSPYPVEAPTPPGAMRDLTGDGIPNVVLTTYSGGMHCCTTHWLVSLGVGGPRLRGRVDAAHGAAEIADLDGDGVPEWTVADWTFAYWHTSFAGSPAPRVILAWDGERLAPSRRLMTERPGWRADLDALAVAVRADAAWTAQRFPPVAYWSTLLDLLYAGRGAEAARFAEAAWPGDALGRTVFLRALADRVWQSPYADVIVDMNAAAVDWL